VVLVAAFPLQGAVPPEAIRPSCRDRPEHPAGWVRRLAVALAGMEGVRVEVVAESRRLVRDYHARVDGLDVTYLRKAEPGRTDPWHLFLPGIRRLRRVLAALRPDVVHGFGTEQAHGLIAVGAFAPAVLKIQGIVDQLQPYVPWPPWKTALWRALERRAVRRAAGIVANTAFSERWARKVSPGGRIAVIPNICPPAFFDVRPTHAEKLVLCPGALSRIKGTETVLKAFAALGDPEARLVMSGWIGDADDYPGLARRLGVADRVEFPGHLPAERIRELMGRARLVVVGSRMDTSPNVIMEAHAAGLPVAGTRTGGIPDMIADGVDGFLSGVDDAAGLADAMRKLLDNAELCRRFGAAGREKVARLNEPAAVARAHLDLYEQVLGWGEKP